FLDKHQCLPVEATEQNKTLAHCQVVIKDLINKNIRKNNVLVAVGGGIIQDITAFIS
ncbi:MAG: 3-dehydroquinate synthase, partial [Aliifodinibius sp.]|nr:3-dehydroquinate synthase [Fodinibius sp.]